jgi:hypothetical protein
MAKTKRTELSSVITYIEHGQLLGALEKLGNIREAAGFELKKADVELIAKLDDHDVMLTPLQLLRTIQLLEDLDNIMMMMPNCPGITKRERAVEHKLNDAYEQVEYDVSNAEQA